MSTDKILFDRRVGFYQDRENVETMEQIYPDPESDNKLFKLGLTDMIQRPVYVPITLVIDNRRGRVSYDVLKHGLELALGHYPWFAGRLNDEHQVESDSVWLARADSKSDFRVDDKFNVLPHEFQFTQAIDAILNSRSKPAPLFAAKATFVEDNCVVLSTLTHHQIADGKTISDFIKLWGEFTCNPDKTPINPIPVPITERTSETKQSQTMAEDKLTDLSILSLKLPLEKLISLQLEVDKNGTNLVSKEDVFVALIWRIVTSAKEITGNSTLLRAMSIHNNEQLNFGLGNKYTVVSCGPKPIPDIISQSIVSITQAVRSSLPSKDTEITSDHITLIRPNRQPIDPERDFKASSHRLFYESTINFQNQPSTVHIHYHAPNMLTTQPDKDGKMFTTLCLNKTLVPKFLADEEVKKYDLEVSINHQN